MKYLPIIILIAVILAAGCAQQAPSPPAQNQAPAQTPPTQPSVPPAPPVTPNQTIVQTSPMNQSQALAIAQSSACAQSGAISVLGTYNNNSGTWWFDITENKSGCNPACVVSENGSAEVNWRCTGLIMYTVMSANSSLGQILVDGNGFTLYTFSDDSENKSSCSGGCAQNWPPVLLTSDTIKVPSTLNGTVGAFARSGTEIQLTFNGMPLYRYAGDSSAGDARGQGIGGKWYVVNVTG